MQGTVQLEKYFAASEITVLAVCFVMLILLTVSFKVRMKSFRIFAAMLYMLIIATLADLTLHYLMDRDPAALSRQRRKPYVLIATALFITFSIADAVGIFTGRTMHIVDGMISFEGATIFTIGYVLFVLLLTVLLIRVRRRLYRQVMIGFFGVAMISIIVLAAARLRMQSTYTSSTFLFPLIAVMYLLHSNPYDALLGANDLRGLNNLIHYSDEKQREYLFLSLYMRELDESGATLSEEMRALIRHVAESYYRKSTLFQVSNGHMLLMVPKDRNPNDYISFIRSIHAQIPENTIHRVQPDDRDKFRRYETILKEVADIAAKKDPDDPRVLVYCQPVYNIRTGKYDTAEALMRLLLDDMGVVFPDQFIPIAEENGYIHVLTEIILSKTCKAISDLLSEGFEVTRISVNVSVMELRDQDFCGDINSIIDRSGVDSSRIAIELTESRNDSDFLVMKEKIEELKKKGITFYLDDFGTGYSNMERILELPFDIIKFDRSMVIAGGQNKRSEQVLGSLADLFSKLNYSVLYEGVENEKDEEMCRGLSASYLQGYKYSKPVPISELKRFLDKE